MNDPERLPRYPPPDWAGRRRVLPPGFPRRSTLVTSSTALAAVCGDGERIVAAQGRGLVRAWSATSWQGCSLRALTGGPPGSACLLPTICRQQRDSGGSGLCLVIAAPRER